MPQLHHTIEVWRPTAGPVDDYNTPSQTYASIATVQALIQPKSGDELAQLNEGGMVRGKYRIFMRSTDVAEGDQLLHLQTSEVYEPTFVADSGGAGKHLEIDAERVYP